MSLRSKHIAIIGGGVGGLTTALLLSRQGVQVTLFEAKKELGGRLAYEEGSGYRIDQGPTIVLLPEMLHSILIEAGVEQSAVEFIRCDPMYRIHYADGTVLTKWNDQKKQMDELDRIFPGEAAGFQRYMTAMKTGFEKGKRAFLDRPFLNKKEFLTVSNLSLLRKLKAYRSVRGIAQKYFKHEKLHDAFSLQTLYIGGAPFSSPGLYTLLPYAEHAFGVWYLKGGYAGLVQTLEAALKAQNVKIRKHTAVTQLHLDGSTCKGLSADGKFEPFDSVVFNGDFPHLAGLLPKEAKPVHARRTFKPSSGCVLLYLGLNRRWENAEAHQFFLPPSLTKSLKTIFQDGKLPREPSFYIFNPVALEEAAAPPGESVLYVLIPSPPDGKLDWDAELPSLIESVLETAENRAFPGLRSAMKWKKIRTPKDAREDGLFQGGSFGIAPTFTQSAGFRPQIVPYEIRGLYAVGASVHPGGGIPIVMQGAKLLSDYILKELT